MRAFIAFLWAHAVALRQPGLRVERWWRGLRGPVIKVALVDRNSGKDVRVLYSRPCWTEHERDMIDITLKTLDD